MQFHALYLCDHKYEQRLPSFSLTRRRRGRNLLARMRTLRPPATVRVFYQKSPTGFVSPPVWAAQGVTISGRLDRPPVLRELANS